MPLVVPRDAGAASPCRIAPVVDPGHVISRPIVFWIDAMSTGSTMFASVPEASAGLDAGPVPAFELEFWLEKQAFLFIPPSDLRIYEGEFVATRNGQVVDHDADLSALTDRFFTRFGDVPVYIAFVGDEPQEYLPSPIL